MQKKYQFNFMSFKLEDTFQTWTFFNFIILGTVVSAIKINECSLGCYTAEDNLGFQYPTK